MINTVEYKKPSTPPPPRPTKSNLRGLNKKQNSDSNIRKQGRFVEQFDQLPPQELLTFINDTKPTKKQRQRTFSTPTIEQSLSFKRNKNNNKNNNNDNNNDNMKLKSDSYFPPTTTVSPPSPSPSTPIIPSTSTSFLKKQASLSKKLTTTSRKAPSPQPKRSFSTNTTFNNNDKDVYRRPASTLASTVAKSTGTGKLLLSLNRASVIILRLEQWLQLMKSLIQWLEETSKLHLQLSRGYSNRHLPLFQMELQPDQTPTASTLYAGFRLITSNVSDQHHKFGTTIQLNHIPTLLKFKKECKEKIRLLRNDPQLLLDELLRRAEQTKKSMDLLNKSCQQADANPTNFLAGKNDPWLANLYVLRQLKREVDEENRLRLLMVPIQKGTEAFEKSLIEALKPIVQYCCEYLAPGIWDGSDDEETAPFQLLMERIVPQHEWEHFYTKEEKELVDPEHPIKDYLKILYPNKLNFKVVTLKKGNMDRYIGGIKIRFSERLYVLSQSGFLHQFSLQDKLVPERSIYIPGATILPIDDCTFEIQRHLKQSMTASTSTSASASAATATRITNKRSTTSTSITSTSSAGSDVSQNNQHINNHNNSHNKQKVYIIKAKNNQDMLSWCKTLSEMANGTLPIVKPRLSNKSVSNTTSTTNNDSIQSQWNENDQLSAPSTPISSSSSIHLTDENNKIQSSSSSTHSAIISPYPSSIIEPKDIFTTIHSKINKNENITTITEQSNNDDDTIPEILEEEEENNEILQRQTMVKLIDDDSNNNNHSKIVMNQSSMLDGLSSSSSLSLHSNESLQSPNHHHDTDTDHSKMNLQLPPTKPYLEEKEEKEENNHYDNNNNNNQLSEHLIKRSIESLKDSSSMSDYSKIRFDRPLSPVEILSKEDTLGNLVHKFTALNSNLNTTTKSNDDDKDTILKSLQSSTSFEMGHSININNNNDEDKVKDLNKTVDMDNKNNNNNDDDDDSLSISSGESISTVTKRYSLLPTTSNQLASLNFDDDDHNDYEDEGDDDDISIHTESTSFTQFDDAATHISSSSSRMSLVSTDYDDAFSHLSSRLSTIESNYDNDDTSSSLYLSSMSTTSSTPTIGLSRSNSLSDFDHHIQLPHLENHA
ncbi:unnamed protein product [Cunninghamella blakesleeana]